jgi:hypothetical protein
MSPKFSWSPKKKKGIIVILASAGIRDPRNLGLGNSTSLSQQEKVKNKNSNAQYTQWCGCLNHRRWEIIYG